MAPIPLTNPRPQVSELPDDGFRLLTFPERNLLIRAAVRAPLVFPGAVGELIARELKAAEDFSYLPAPTSLIARLVTQVMETGPPHP